MAQKSSKALARDEGEWSERVDALKETVQDFDGQVREAVREHPLACLVGAIAAGYLVGRLVARS